mmetsp:Transcript_43518/g.111276  ORF Transcript_43518/g.111276 Transcript_43518/m.111276 type:complete len:210 (+) Transcript_43518:460-1089(+)
MPPAGLRGLAAPLRVDLCHVHSRLLQHAHRLEETFLPLGRGVDELGHFLLIPAVLKRFLIAQHRHAPKLLVRAKGGLEVCQRTVELAALRALFGVGVVRVVAATVHVALQRQRGCVHHAHVALIFPSVGTALVVPLEPRDLVLGLAHQVERARLEGLHALRRLHTRHHHQKAHHLSCMLPGSHRSSSPVKTPNPPTCPSLFARVTTGRR